MREKTFLIGLSALMLICSLTGCAYLGFHGPSIQSFPDVHQGVMLDQQCLGCHHPDHASAPPTPHPSFTGCLKCHDDEIKGK